MVSKVLAYIVRGDELLVFRHRDYPEAGLQVPAGTIEQGECSRSAVLREVYEESGLEAVRIVRLLGRYLHNAAPYRDEVHDRHVYHLQPTEPLESTWLHYEHHPSDGGPPIAFQFFWMRLDDPGLHLAGGQGELLDRLAQG
jgi:8-oxo-dGTP pyrophosphatase MutT (NUDIX family)